MPGRWGSVGCFGGVLRPESLDIGAHLGITPLSLEKSPDPPAGKVEQRTVDELDRCSGALDVEENGANVGQFALARIGMYEGPMQSG